MKDPRDKEGSKTINWVEADLVSITKQPNVVAYNHHGGANSYCEGALRVDQIAPLPTSSEFYMFVSARDYRRPPWHSGTTCMVCPSERNIEVSVPSSGRPQQGLCSHGKCLKSLGRERRLLQGHVERRGKGTAVDKLLETIERKE